MADSVMDSIKAAWSSKEEPATEKTATETGAGEGAGTQVSEDTYDAPSDWAHEEREQFRAYQPEVRKWALGKLKTVEDGWKTKAADLEKFQGTYKPFEDLFNSPQYQPHMRGMPSHEVTRRLLDQLAFANTRPEDFVRNFVQTNRLDPATLFQLQKQAEAADQGGWVDPEVQALKTEIAQLRQGFQETHQQIVQRQQSEQNARAAEWQKQIDDFRNAPGADGKSPKHPYMKDVEGHMAALIRDKLAKDLPDAYDQAVYANPIVRAKVLADAKAAERLAAAKAEREHAAKAQRAGATITGSATRSEAPSQSNAKKNESVRDSIRRAHADLTKETA